ncbi:hypothetical protein PR202_gb19580 [Eleusine coracana subsp. coracana]|uniref:Small-subunit processome Utp12 domain-containing protein n=1 Tax=Eleusine coracana subsp. coracana TaxID=191504 RepID=A0AAV5F6B1_ELECO|nr:hypothetical protein PR202_gb19580 [Eleusine coracana subsp. coracana]
MAPAVAPIRDLLTSFSPDADSVTAATANSLLLPLAQVWDAARSRLQTEFADIPSVEVGAAAEAKRGHLALDYTCMKWVQLSNKKKMKAGSSVLVLGTGSGDVLALDVAGAQWKWRVSDCHPGGVTAVAYSKHGRCVYTAGTDGMVYEGGLHVFAISEIGVCYFWSGNNVDDLRNKKPTKIALSKSSLARPQQAFSIFAAKLQGVDGPDSAHVLLAYGSVVKPSFDKLLVCHGTDINLDISQDGVLLPNIQTTVPTKGQSAKKQGSNNILWLLLAESYFIPYIETVTALDRANAEDATLPLPKLHTQEKKRKHAETKPSDDVEPTKPSGDVEPAIDTDITTARLIPKRVPVQRIEDDSICIEDMMKECGVIDNRVDQSLETILAFPLIFYLIYLIRAHLRSLKPKDACKLLDSLVSAWKTRSGRSELVLRWIYCLLVIHGRFIPTEKSRKLIGSLEKMCVERYSATEDLLKLSGRLRLIVAQVDMNASVSDPPTEQMQDADAAAVQSDEEDDEEIDETVFGQDSDLSQTSDDDAE